MLFGRIRKQVYFYVLYCNVAEVSVPKDVKECQIVLPSPFAMWSECSWQVCFNVIPQQCDGCEKWHLSVQFHLHPRSNKIRCLSRLNHDDVPNCSPCVSTSLTLDRFIVPGSGQMAYYKILGCCVYMCNLMAILLLTTGKMGDCYQRI